MRVLGKSGKMSPEGTCARTEMPNESVCVAEDMASIHPGERAAIGQPSRDKKTVALQVGQSAMTVGGGFSIFGIMM